MSNLYYINKFTDLDNNLSYLQNKFYNIIEKIVFYLNTIYSNDIEYQNEYRDPAFNYKYIKRKICEYKSLIRDINNINYNTDIINIIDEELPDRLFDDYYYEMVEELEDYYNCDQDDYFEEYEVEDEEAEEDTRTIDYNFRYNVNVINYLDLFISGDEKDNIKEYIETILENLLIAENNCLK